MKYENNLISEERSFPINPVARLDLEQLIQAVKIQEEGVIGQ
jgi:hypothetical protein